MHPRCSFCGGTPVAWYEGPDFLRSVPSPDQVRSEEAWLACDLCVPLVEAGDRDALALRSAPRSDRASGDLTGSGTFVAIREHHDRDLWAHRGRGS